ncbi:MAG: DUF2225 domain-containing protein [Candidatus Ranarchaeia archaeon]
MTTLFQENVRCPRCSVIFEATVLGSFGHTSRTTDFMPRFWGLNPLPFFVHVCPKREYPITHTFSRELMKGHLGRRSRFQHGRNIH